LALFGGGSSFGDDINYDPDFDLIKIEIGKLGGLDYELLEQKSLSLLKEKSKDVRLFSFLAMCYLKRNEWELFCDTFDALGQLVEKDYNALFPARPRAKQLAFKWLGEDKALDIIEKAVPVPAAYEHIKRLLAGLLIIKGKLDTEFPNGSPFPARLQAAAQKWERQTEPKKEVTPPPQSQTATQAANTAAVATSNANQAPVSPGQAGSGSTGASLGAASMESVKDALEIVRKAAIFLIEKEPLKPAGYRLMRSVRWDPIENAPVAEGNVTRIDPLPEERRNFIQSLLGKGDFKVAFETVEKAFSSGVTIYWLDLQRIAATAAKQLGPSYAAVRDVILLETAAFVKRVPKIQNLSYSDGTPFCDPSTIDWLNTDVAAIMSSGNGASGNADDPVEIDRRAANELSAANKTDGAIDLLMKRISESGSERDNFRRKVIVASTMISAKRPDLAIYILEYLVEIIDRNNLLSWEPSLAAEALNLLVRAYQMAATGKEDAPQLRILEKREVIMKKLSFVDPKIAFTNKQ